MRWQGGTTPTRRELEIIELLFHFLYVFNFSSPAFLSVSRGDVSQRLFVLVFVNLSARKT